MTASTVETTAPQIAINDIGSEEDLPRRDRRDDQVLQRRRHRRRHHRQGRPRRGPARHRLQDRGCHPLARAVDQARRRPQRGRLRRRRGRGPGPPEGGQGGSSDPVQEARPVRARLGHDREDQGGGRRRHRHRHRGRQGWPHPRHRPARLPARVARRDASGPRPPAVRRQGDRGQDHRARQEPQQRGPVAPCLARADPVRGPPRPSSSSCSKGQVRSGVVSSIVNFGAFVDLGGVDGLVHVSELSWKHIDHPSEVVEVGDEVTVEVLDVDMDRERVSLSLKATQEDPWQQFARTHAIGQVVPGKVTKLVPVRCVRARRRRHRGPGPHLRAGRAPRGAAGAGRHGRRRHLRQGHRHRPRASPHLAVAQAGERGLAPTTSDFDPTLYGMAAEYDETGNYKYPDGFDPETNEWLPGFETQREAWERQYAEAHARWEAHKKQVESCARPTPRPAVAEPTPSPARSPTPRPPRRPRARSPPTRRCRHCARSSPAPEPRLARTQKPSASAGSRASAWPVDRERRCRSTPRRQARAAVNVISTASARADRAVVLRARGDAGEAASAAIRGHVALR